MVLLTHSYTTVCACTRFLTRPPTFAVDLVLTDIWPWLSPLWAWQLFGAVIVWIDRWIFGWMEACKDGQMIEPSAFMVGGGPSDMWHHRNVRKPPLKFRQPMLLLKICCSVYVWPRGSNEWRRLALAHLGQMPNISHLNCFPLLLQ